ncbi:MAG: tRNA glutamyl-Q(34) synthetase GluQRS [Aestuariivirgaceae bacterium]
MTVPTYRFAPSPNGELHLGHAFSALFAFHAAKRAGGNFLLRIEDIDTTRCREHVADRIFDDLAWLGLDWLEPVRFQSRHLADYSRAQSSLESHGLLYPCFCTRKNLEASSSGRRDPDGSPLYPGTCRALDPEARAMAAGEPFHLRLDMARAVQQAAGLFFTDLGIGDISADPHKWGDVILVRKDIGTSYHIAVVVDDALQEVTHVTRGRDLFEATHIHRLLQALLGLPVPLYHHHRLISDAVGRKLSKSAADRSLRSLREGGVSPAEIRRTLGF